LMRVCTYARDSKTVAIISRARDPATASAAPRLVAGVISIQSNAQHAHAANLRGVRRSTLDELHGVLSMLWPTSKRTRIRRCENIESLLCRVQNALESPAPFTAP